MEKNCPRCGEKFECKHEDIARCACSKIKLSQAASALIAKTHGNQCLCVRCLQEIEKESHGEAGRER